MGLTQGNGTSMAAVVRRTLNVQRSRATPLPCAPPDATTQTPLTHPAPPSPARRMLQRAVLAVRTVVEVATTVAITVAADQVAHTYAQPRPIPALALLSTIPKAGHAGCRQKQRSLASSPMASATVCL